MWSLLASVVAYKFETSFPFFIPPIPCVSASSHKNLYRAKLLKSWLRGMASLGGARSVPMIHPPCEGRYLLRILFPLPATCCVHNPESSPFQASNLRECRYGRLEVTWVPYKGRHPFRAAPPVARAGDGCVGIPPDGRDRIRKRLLPIFVMEETHGMSEGMSFDRNAQHSLFPLHPANIGIGPRERRLGFMP